MKDLPFKSSHTGSSLDDLVSVEYFNLISSLKTCGDSFDMNFLEFFCQEYSAYAMSCHELCSVRTNADAAICTTSWDDAYLGPTYAGLLLKNLGLQYFNFFCFLFFVFYS